MKQIITILFTVSLFSSCSSFRILNENQLILNKNQTALNEAQHIMNQNMLRFRQELADYSSRNIRDTCTFSMGGEDVTISNITQLECEHIEFICKSIIAQHLQNIKANNN